MKLVLVLCACVAGSLASLVSPLLGAQNAAAGADLGKYGADALSASDLLRDARRTNSAADLWANTAQQAARRGGNYGDEVNQASGRQQAARQDAGQNAANWDQSSDANARAAARDQAWAQNQNQWARKDAADRAAANNYWAEGDQFRQGRRNHDNIDYGFDKKFNTRSSEDGGYEYSESSDSHALDDYADRKGLYDRRRSDHLANAAKADAQAADRKAAYAQTANAAAAAADKFGRDYDSSAWANGRNKDLAQKLDASQAGNRYWSDARDRALDAYADFTNRDSNAARQSKAFGDADGKLGGVEYGYGVAGVEGYAPKVGAYPYGADGAKGVAAADYAKRAGAADLARLWDQSAKNSLKQAAKDSSRDEAKASFSKDQWLNDRVQGFDRDQAAKANDHGYSDWANKADQSAAGYDAKSADAKSSSAAQQGRWDLDENVWKQDERKRNLSDREANKKVSKKYYRNQNNGGDNVERLNYDRDQIDDVFGFKNGVKKDAANRLADSRYNSAFDAAARKADAARAADSARSNSANDWRKEANGWANADAAYADRASADRKGLRNDNYKSDLAQNAYDKSYDDAQAWDQAADRYGADKTAYGKNIGAYGKGYAAVAAPYAVGYGYGAPYYGNSYGYAPAFGYAKGGYPYGYY